MDIHEESAKLTSSFFLQILLQPQFSSVTPSLLYPSCMLYSLLCLGGIHSFSDACCPSPTPTHVHTCVHVHTHTPQKDDIPQIWPNGPIREQCAYSPGLDGRGDFKGIDPEGGPVSFPPLYIIMWGCTNILLERAYWGKGNKK